MVVKIFFAMYITVSVIPGKMGKRPLDQWAIPPRLRPGIMNFTPFV